MTSLDKLTKRGTFTFPLYILLFMTAGISQRTHRFNQASSLRRRFRRYILMVSGRQLDGKRPSVFTVTSRLQIPARGGELIWTPKTSRGCGATTRNNSTTTTWNYTGGSPGFSTFSRVGGRQDSNDRQHESCGPNPESGGEGPQLHMHPLSADGLSSHLGRQSEYIRLIPRHTPGHPNVSADRLSRRLQIINTRRSPSQQLPTHAWCYT